MRKLLLVCGLSLPLAAAGATPPNEMNQEARPKLVLTGASYAGSWNLGRLGAYHVVNRGRSGDTTAQVLARFDADVLALTPDAVLIWGHINDIHRAPAADRSAARERIQANFREMVKRARARGAVVMLGTEVTLSEAVGFGNRLAAFVGRMRGKQGYNAKINIEVRAVNEWLRDYARQEGLRLFDFERVLDDGEGFRKVEFTSDDGTHISVAGYAALTSYAQKQLGGP